MRFVCDAMLGRLAKYLRLLGFDAEYAKSRNSLERILARDSDRTLLTRRVKVRGAQKHIHIREDVAREQLREIREILTAAIDRSAILKRCIECNVELSEVEKSDIESLVPEFVYHHHSRFKVCPSCHKVFWGGSHAQGMERLVQEILA
jgi:uncharacterized protein